MTLTTKKSNQIQQKKTKTYTNTKCGTHVQVFQLNLSPYPCLKQWCMFPTKGTFIRNLISNNTSHNVCPMLKYVHTKTSTPTSPPRERHVTQVL